MLRGLVLDSVPSPHTKRAYDHALFLFGAWFRDNPARPFDKATVQLTGSG
jgi:hypothetical protein